MPVEPKPLTLEVVTHHAGGCPAEYKNVGVSASVQFLNNIVTENSLVTDAKGAIYCGITCANEKANGGLLRSRDQGRTWECMIPSLPGDPGTVLNSSMGSICVDPQTGRLFASSCGDPTCVPDNPWAEKVAKLLRDRRTWSDVIAYSDDQGDIWTVVRGQFKDGGDWGKTFLGPPATPASKKTWQRTATPTSSITWRGRHFA